MQVEEEAGWFKSSKEVVVQVEQEGGCANPAEVVVQVKQGGGCVQVKQGGGCASQARRWLCKSGRRWSGLCKSSKEMVYVEQGGCLWKLRKKVIGAS